LRVRATLDRWALHGRLELSLAASRLRRVALAAFAVGLAFSISLSELSLALLVVALALDGSRRPWRASLGWPIAIFLAWTAVAALASARPVESLFESKESIWLLTIPVLANALDDRVAAQRWVRLLLTCTAIASLFAIAQHGLCPATRPDVRLLAWFFHRCDRARGFFSIYMTLAGVLSVVLVTTLPGVVRALDRDRSTDDRASTHAFGARTRLWPAAGWLLGVLALALTYVRGAWVGFALGAAASLAIAKRRVVLLIGFVAILAVAAALPGVAARARTIGNLADETTRDRLAMLHGGLRMFAERPWTGIGPGQVKHLYPLYAPPQALRRHTSHLHDTPLQILVERGAPGIALWLALFAVFFVRATRILRRLPGDAEDERALVGGVVAAIAAFLLGGLSEYNFGDTEVLLVASAVMALPFVIAADSRATREG
jgi:O-antigen ligase/polysaccharide polymerase Wzy-like membrane protein